MPFSALQSEFSKNQTGGNGLWLITKRKNEGNSGSGKKLRSLGVDEDTIEQLRTYDWAIFNSDRRYYEKLQDAGTYLEEVTENMVQPEIKTVEDFSDSIENQGLYQALIKADKITLQIALWKMDGYSSSEISEKCGLTVGAINFRLWHLRKKLKNIL